MLFRPGALRAQRVFGLIAGDHRQAPLKGASATLLACGRQFTPRVTKTSQIQGNAQRSGRELSGTEGASSAQRSIRTARLDRFQKARRWAADRDEVRRAQALLAK